MTDAHADLATALDDVFAADQALYEAEARFLAGPADAVIAHLRAETEATLARPTSTATVRKLRRLADLTGQIPGRESVRNLLRLLGHEDPSVRGEAGHVLRDLVYDRFKEVALEVEAALDAGQSGLAMEELPFLLTDVYDPNPMPLLVRFLEHADAQVVASTIEALAEYGDPGAIPHLEKLVDDPREATVDDLDEGSVAVGDLARDALSLLDGGE